jgi:pimeloyl-ACP methyl ester carboxylesterase
MAARPDRLTALEDLEVPALVLRGADDASAPQASAQTMAEALADVEVVVVPRAGHLSAVEAPEEVAAALRALYERSAQGAVS